MFCRFCGKNIPDDSQFCAHCGKALTLLPAEEFYDPTAQEKAEKTVTSVAVMNKAAENPERKRWIVMSACLFFMISITAALLATKVLCFHQWQDATCTAPMTCSRCADTKGQSLKHNNIPATCTDPATCTSCGEMFGSALGHTLHEATCTKAKYCTRCFKTFGKPAEHIWLEETFTTPPTCEACQAVAPMSQPSSGTVYIEANKYCSSKLTINAAADYNTYFKLKDEQGNDVISFYVRAGETSTVKVPADNLYLYFASGIDWYGPELVFGSDTVYEKDAEVFDFYNYTWTYTFDAGSDGNTTSTVITSAEF